MISGWKQKPFSECIEPVRVDRARQIKSSAYLPEGEFPIVDQGQGLVAGWTNNGSTVLRDGLPYIVFGDHTRLLKYVDFPFALGADGTKLISPSEDINPRYFYYALYSLDIPSRGYSRHYRLLKEQNIPLPSLPEQKKIAAVLLKVQRAIETQDKIIQSLRDLKKSTMQHLFTHGLRGEEWKEILFGDFATLHRGYDLPVQARGSGDVPIIGSNGIVGYHSEAKISGPGVVTGRSGSIGISYYVEQDFWPLNTGLYVSDFHGNHPHFVHHFFDWFDFSRYAAGVSVPTLNRNIVHNASIKIPDKSVQIDIATSLSALDAKMAHHKSKKSALQDLFKTTLNKLMTGEIRVADLDIDVKEVEV